MDISDIKTAAQRDALIKQLEGLEFRETAEEERRSSIEGEWINLGDVWRLKSERDGFVAVVDIHRINPEHLGWSTSEESGPEIGDEGKALAEAAVLRQWAAEAMEEALEAAP